MARSLLARCVALVKGASVLCGLALAGCGEGVETSTPDFAVPPSVFGFDAGNRSSDEGLLHNYELIDIASSESCERLPLGPGLLAPDNQTSLLCLRHSDCPAFDLCSARISCGRGPQGCLAVVSGTQCAGDECQRDADCPTGARCFCEAGRKECLIASCSSDSDCAAGQRCRETWLQRQATEEHLTCNGDQKYYACTTPEDECSDDEDCPPYDARCGYDRPRNRFACLTCGWRVP